MANDRDRMTDDRSGSSPMRGEGDMGGDRMGEGGGSRERREGGTGEDMNRDDVRGIADEGDEEFDETEDMEEEEEEEEER